MEHPHSDTAPLSDPLSTYIETELRRLNDQFIHLRRYGETLSVDELLGLDPPLRIAYRYRGSLLFARTQIAKVDQKFEAIFTARSTGKSKIERSKIMELRDHFLQEMEVSGDPLFYFMDTKTSDSIVYELQHFLNSENWPSTTSRRPPFRQRWSTLEELQKHLDRSITNLREFLITPIERRLDRFGAGLSAIRSKALDHVATPALACQVLNEWVEEVLERVKSSQILGNGTKFRNVLDVLWVLQHDPTITRYTIYDDRTWTWSLIPTLQVARFVEHLANESQTRYRPPPYSDFDVWAERSSTPPVPPAYHALARSRRMNCRQAQIYKVL